MSGLIVCLLALGASLLGPWLLPLDIIANFRLHLVAMAVVLLCATWLSRRWIIVVAVGTVATLLLIGAIVPALTGGEATPPGRAANRSYTIVSFNTWLRQYQWREIERYLRSTKPDFVVMVEAGRAIKPLFAALRDLYPWQTECAAWRYCHIAILSRHRWRNSAFKQRTGSSPPLAWAQFGPALGGFTLIGTHLNRPPNIANQLRQVQTLSRRILAISGPVVLAGDFNATPWSFVYKTLVRSGGLTGFSAIAPSWPAYPFNLPQLPIDHVFVSRKLSIRLLEVGPAMGSDHRSIRAEITLPQR